MDAFFIQAWAEVELDERREAERRQPGGQGQRSRLRQMIARSRQIITAALGVSRWAVQPRPTGSHRQSG